MTPQQILDFIKGLIEELSPAIAVALWNYQEDKVDHETKEKEAAQLATKNLQDEQAIKAQYAGKSDADIIKSFADDGSGTGSGSKPRAK